MRSGSPRQLSHGRRAKWDTSGVLLDPGVLSGPIDLPAVFGNGRPIELEVGTGKGTFLLARAAARSDLNFLGIELARAYCCYAADRIRRRGLANVRMAQADAAHFFRLCLTDAAVWRVHIYFPDPWPKRKHHRRRLIKPPFLADVRRVLQLGGQLIVVTDHREYFGQIRRVLCSVSGLARISLPRIACEQGELAGTNFERKYLAEGRPFYAAARMRYA